jgi:hypothetical protein
VRKLGRGRGARSASTEIVPQLTALILRFAAIGAVKPSRHLDDLDLAALGVRDRRELGLQGVITGIWPADGDTSGDTWPV